MSTQRERAPKVIYLVDDSADVDSRSWCEDPAPSIGMLEENAIKYIRSDIDTAHQDTIKKLRESLARCIHQASYSIGDSEALANQLSNVRSIADEALKASKGKDSAD